MKINTILLTIASALLLIILTATVTVFCVRRTLLPFPKQDVAPAFPQMQNIGSASSSERAYTGVGAVRSITARQTAEVEGGEGDEGVPVIVTAWFSYPKDDRAFFEELATKSTTIKKTIETYFAEHTKSELTLMGEEAIKKELQDRINSLLTLGQIGTLYFSEYIFLD